jgi:hypothetical protein
MSGLLTFLAKRFAAALSYTPSLDFSDARNSQYWLFFI